MGEKDPKYPNMMKKYPKDPHMVKKYPKYPNMMECLIISTFYIIHLWFSMFINDNFQVKLLPCEYNRQISANTKGGRWAKYFRWEAQIENS